MNLGEFLNTLAGKAGIPNDDNDLKSLLSNQSVSEYKMPDTIVSKLESGLMSLDAAKNNSDVLKLVRAQVYNGVDSELNKAYEELGLEDAIKSELLQEKSTPKRIAISLKKIQELEKSKASASRGDKAEMQKEIDRLNTEIKNKVSEYESKLSEKEIEKQKFVTDHEINSMLSGYNYALPKDMDVKIKVQTARLALNEELNKKGAKIAFENGASKLMKAESNSDYYDEKNNKMDVKGFMDSVLAQYKLLSVNGTVKSEQTQQVSQELNGKPQAQITQSWDKAMSEAKSMVEKVA